MANKPIDKIVLTIVILLLVCVSVLNLCQKERPTVSETENRTLATMPEFSVNTLLSGKYFADIGAFISDTFLMRDTLVSMSKEMDTLKSLSAIRPQEGISVIIDPNAGQHEEQEDLTIPTLPEIPTVPPTEPPTEAPTEVEVIPLILSQSSISFIADESCTIYAIIGEGYENLTWELDGNEDIAITDIGDDRVTIKATAACNALLKASVTGFGEVYTIECEIVVKELEIKAPAVEAADFLPNGLIIYNGAAYSQSYLSNDYAPAFAKIYNLYATLFPESQMSVVIAPLATITITDPSVSMHLSDQGAILDGLEAQIFGDVNFVNLKETYLKHANEYLYFRSDHHWTHRGAYYAYAEFAKSVGLTPTPLSLFEKYIIREDYIGSMYNYTGDGRVKEFYDTIEVYMPNKAHTMKINYGGGYVIEKDSCIQTEILTYVAFLSGDQPFIVINVPENPQDKTILVIKDSFGNAFVPYLTEHYGNIVVIDPRHADVNIHDFYSTYCFTDIVFMVNSTSANTGAWYTYLIELLK